MSTNSTRLFDTPAQVASCLGVTKQTVINWCKAGKIRYAKTLGGHYRISHKTTIALRSRQERQHRLKRLKERSKA